MRKIEFTKVVSWCVGLLVLTLSTPLNAQQTVQVVTKTVEKSLTFQQGDTLSIHADKADVDLVGWDQNTIQIKLVIVAKHPTKEQAIKDLSYVQHEIETNGKIHLVSNSIDLTGKFPDIKSKLSTSYQIKIPRNCHLNLWDRYGETKVSQVDGLVRLTQIFGNSKLTDLKGEVHIESKYGDITAQNIASNLEVNCQKANIYLIDLQQQCKIKSKWGKVSLVSVNRLKGLDIDATHTDISLILPNFTEYQFDVTNKSSDIILPSGYSYITNPEESNSFVMKNPAKPMIKIATSHRLITLNEIQHADNRK